MCCRRRCLLLHLLMLLFAAVLRCWQLQGLLLLLLHCHHCLGRRLQCGQLAEQRRMHWGHIGHTHIVAGSDAGQQRCHVVQQELNNRKFWLACRVSGIERWQGNVVGEAAEQIRRWWHDRHVGGPGTPVLLVVALVACCVLQFPRCGSVNSWQNSVE